MRKHLKKIYHPHMLQISFHHQYQTLIQSFLHKIIKHDNCYEIKGNPQLYKFHNFTKVHI